MPLYEYRCDACGNVFEKIARWSEADRSPFCPQCQSENTHKKVSTFASTSSSSSSYSAASSSCGSRGGFS